MDTLTCPSGSYYLGLSAVKEKEIRSEEVEREESWEQ